MFFAKSGATGCNSAANTRSVGSHDIGVAFNNDNPASLSDFFLRKIQAIQDLGLVINRRFRGVEVLRGFLILIIQTPGTKTNSRARNIADWPHQSSPETVIKSAVTPSRQTGSFNLLIGESLRTKVTCQRIPRGRRVANPKVAAHRFIKAPAAQKLTPEVSVGGRELCLIKLLSHAMRVKKALAATRLLAAKSPASRGLVTQSDPGFERQGFHGLGKGQ